MLVLGTNKTNMAAGCEVGGKGNKGQQFRFSLTGANDDDESDFHRYSGLVVFQRYASIAADQEQSAREVSNCPIA